MFFFISFYCTNKKATMARIKRKLRKEDVENILDLHRRGGNQMYISEKLDFAQSTISRIVRYYEGLDVGGHGLSGESKLYVDMYKNGDNKPKQITRTFLWGLFSYTKDI